ncbi:hypothetical protein ABGT18_05105 [Pseudomonas putida]|uniref:hypothetical protein n=1 Tax=Pseudomonas putida TaxID=303 RepID=UPI00345CE0F4
MIASAQKYAETIALKAEIRKVSLPDASNASMPIVIGQVLDHFQLTQIMAFQNYNVRLHDRPPPTYFFITSENSGQSYASNRSSARHAIPT